MEDSSFPTYGSILKIKDKESKFENTLFFVQYISNEIITLISNKGLEQLELKINDDGELEDKNIDEFQIIYKPNGGYAEQNNLKIGKEIKITMMNDDEYSGIIEDVVEDMIIVKVKSPNRKTDSEEENEEDFNIYIDFHYGGIDEKYGIKHININKQPTQKSNQFFIPLPEGNVEKIKQKIDEIGNSSSNNANMSQVESMFYETQHTMIYSIDQQIDDYIEYSFKMKHDKRKVMFEVSKYKELINKYVDFEHNIKEKRLPEHIILDYISSQKFKHMHPVTSHGFQIFSIKSGNYAKGLEHFDDIMDKEMNEQYDNSLLINESSNIESLEEDYFNNIDTSIKYSNRKNHHGDKVLKTYKNTKLYLMENENEIENDNVIGYYGIKNGKLDYIKQYQVNLDSDSLILYDGYMFPKRQSLLMYLNFDENTSLLNKSLQNLNPYYDINNTSIVKKEANHYKVSDCELYGNQNIFIPFSDEETSLKSYFNQININDFYIFKCIENRKFTNLYQIINSLQSFGVFDLNNRYFQYLNKYVTKYNKQLRNYYRNHVVNVKNKPINLSYRENLHNAIIQNYNVVNIERKHNNEILQRSIIDQHNLLTHTLRINDNKRLYDVLLKNQDLVNYLDTLTRELESIMGNPNSENIERNIVKTYDNLQQLQNDFNKIIFIDIEGEMSVYQLIHNHLIGKQIYNEPFEMFVGKINFIQESNDLDAETHKDAFNDESLFNIKQFMNKYSVKQNDVAQVTSNNKYYIYHGSQWIEENEYKKKKTQKKVLSIRNREIEFDGNRESIINDYIIQLTNNIAKEKQFHIEEDEQNLVEYEKRMKQKNNKRMKLMLNNILKYNKHKEHIEKSLYYENSVDSIVHSKYYPLLNEILALEDENMKYEYIIRFIQNYTIDTGNKSWLMCIESGVKLIPKYLKKLANVYLIHNDLFETTLNEICKNEGTLSEDGDKWVHKESGYTLKNIDFNTNFGIDNDGNLIQQNEVLPIETSSDDILDEEGYDTELISINMYDDDPTITLEKTIVLTDFQKEILHNVLSMCEIFGIKLKTEDKIEHIVKEINNIYNSFIRKTKDKSNIKPFMYQTYAIVCFLLCYVQFNHIKVKKTFPNCKSTFSGFPLDDTEMNNDGIIYLACVIKQLSKSAPYDIFKVQTTEELANNILKFMKFYVLHNAYIISNMNQARDRIRRRIALGLNETDHLEKTIHIFRPSLKDIDVGQDFIYKEGISNQFLNYLHINDYMHFLNKKLEAQLSNHIENHTPLFTTKYEQPFLSNHCCHDSDYLIDYIVQEDTTAKNELNRIMKLITQCETEKSIAYENTIRNYSLCIVKEEPPRTLRPSNKIDYDESTVYMYFIYNCNFDYDLPIPSYFVEKMHIEKPSSVYYNKNVSLNEKIQVLKENGYNFTQEQMIIALKDMSKITHKTTLSSVVNTEQKEKIIMDFEETLFDSHEKASQTFDGYTRKIIQVYKNYNKTILGIKMNTFDKFLEYIQNIELLSAIDIQNLANFIRNINYFLSSIYPNFVMKQKEETNIFCKHWDLAKPHYDDIQKKYKEFIETINMIEINELEYQEQSNLFLKLQEIQKLGEFVHYDKYKSNFFTDYMYQKYLCLYLLEQYMNVTMTKSKSIIALKLNNTIMGFMKYMLKNNRNSYESIKKKMYQTKQSEKQIKTDYLKNMKKAQRKVEELKMKHKLGVWSVGLKKNIYKYDKDFYMKNLEEAEQVQDIANSIYNIESDQLNPYSIEDGEEEHVDIVDEGYNDELREDGDDDDEYGTDM